MFFRIFDPRVLTVAATLLFGAAALHAEPGTGTPTPPTKKASPDAPATKTDGAKKTKTLPARLAHVTNHGRNFRGWSNYCWFPRYRCYGYCNASQRMWFYYYEPFATFLPVRYLSTYPPSTVGIGPVSNVAAAPAAAASGSLPAGATTIPASAPAPADADAPADQ